MAAYGYTHLGPNFSYLRATSRPPEPTLLVMRGDVFLKVSLAILKATEPNIIEVMEFAPSRHSLAIAGALVSADLIGDRAGFAMLVDVSNGAASLRGEVVKFPLAVKCLAHSPDGRLLAIGTRARDDQKARQANVTIMDALRLKKRAEFRAFNGSVLSLAFSADSKQLFVAGEDKAIHVFSSMDWKPMAKLDGHSDTINAIRVSPDGKYLASGGDDKAVILWRLKD